MSNDLKSNLAQFTGTESHTRWSSLFHNHVLTDGTKYVAEKCGAYWLMDVIASYASADWYKKNPFITATLKVKDGKGCVKFTDGNDNVLQYQDFEYTDFPLDEITIWNCDNGDYRVLMLPSEY